MEIIDDSGRLFGYINIVDLLVVLLVASVLIAGAALVFGSDSSNQTNESTYVTLDLGTHNSQVVNQLSVGDSFSPSANSELRITDLYITPGGDGAFQVFARINITGEVSEDAFQYDGAPLRFGRELIITTDRYEVNGSIISTGNGSTLSTATTQALVEAEIDDETSSRIAEGDSIRFDDYNVATVETVARYGTADPGRQKVLVGLSLNTLSIHDQQYFGSTPVQPGKEIPIQTNSYSFNGTIDRVGTASIPGTPITRTVTLRETGVHQTIAESYESGMVEQWGETTIARVTDVNVTRSRVLIYGSDDELISYFSPTKRDLTVTAELAMHRTEHGYRFKGEPVQIGSEIVLDLDDRTLEATIVAMSE